MTIEETHKIVNDIYAKNVDIIIKGFRENDDKNEMSFDFEEVFDEDKTMGSMIDFLIENEKCEIWDLPYVIHLLLNHPDQVHEYPWF